MKVFIYFIIVLSILVPGFSSTSYAQTEHNETTNSTNNIAKKLSKNPGIQPGTQQSGSTKQEEKILDESFVEFLFNIEGLTRNPSYCNNMKDMKCIIGPVGLNLCICDNYDPCEMIDNALKDPKEALKSLKKNPSPFAKGLRAYLYYTDAVKIENGEKSKDEIIANLMESAFREMYTEEQIKLREKMTETKIMGLKSYDSLATLLRHLSMLMPYVIPAQFIKKHPAEAREAFKPIWMAAGDDFLRVCKDNDHPPIMEQYGLFTSSFFRYDNAYRGRKIPCSGSMWAGVRRSEQIDVLAASYAPQIFVNICEGDEYENIIQSLKEIRNYGLMDLLVSSQILYRLAGLKNIAETSLKSSSTLSEDDILKASNCIAARLDFQVNHRINERLEGIRSDLVHRFFNTGNVDYDALFKVIESKKLAKTELTTLLIAAIINGAPPRIIKALVKAGADVNGSDYTPLMTAAAVKPSLIATLIELGADINKRNKVGGTALVYAIQYGAKDVITYLLKKGANTDVIVMNSKDVCPQDECCDDPPINFYYATDGEDLETFLYRHRIYNDKEEIRKLLRYYKERNVASKKSV